jgi:cytochrome b pre-mRNA-processing protein 3
MEGCPVSLLSRIFGKPVDDLAHVRPLWQGIVEAAREPKWYAEHGVSDTVPGRFDAVTLVLSLVMLRMERDEALIEPSVRLTELFVEDMDGQLRQSGVGDLVVGKRMGKLMSVLGGRLGALREALPQGQAAVAEVVARNVTLNEGVDGAGVAAEAVTLARHLDTLSREDVLAGAIRL